MKIYYGVEMKVPKEKLPGYTTQIIRRTAELARVIDRDDQLVIIESRNEAEQLAAFYHSKNLLENEFTLYQLEHNETTALFSDYGFFSENNKAYLYQEFSLPLIINNGDKAQIEMALLQIKEHLIAKEIGNQNVYFIDRNQKELIEKYAQAYDITVSFPSNDENASRQIL